MQEGMQQRSRVLISGHTYATREAVQGDTRPRTRHKQHDCDTSQPVEHVRQQLHEALRIKEGCERYHFSL